jgi:hypothetical protein
MMPMLVDVTADDSRARERSPLLGLRTSSTCMDEVIGRYSADCGTAWPCGVVNGAVADLRMGPAGN